MNSSAGARGFLVAALATIIVATSCSAGPDPARAENGTVASASAQLPAGPVEELTYEVVKRFPHDPEAYTQGLAFHRGRFYEGTGLEGESSLRRVALRTGAVKKRIDLADEYFGEGVTLIGDKVFQITWQEEEAFVYDVATFELLETFNYHVDGSPDPDEGWGLADDGQQLAMSDGTEIIRFRDPETFEVTREIRVTENGTPVFSLNELEWIGDEIYANVFGYTHIVRIDPETGFVTGRLELLRLKKREDAKCQNDEEPPEVMNGIAYLQGEKRFFVTGKLWCHIYEIELSVPPG